MEFASIKQRFLVPGAVGIVLLLWAYKRRGLAFLVAVAVMVGFNDFFSHHILKETIARERPCHVLENITRVMNCSNSFSFPSNHASNIFTFATLLTLCFRRLIFLALPLALVVGYSRVYLGVHYPLDVLGGAVLGIGMGVLGFQLYRRILKFMERWPLFKNESAE